MEQRSHRFMDYATISAALAVALAVSGFVMTTLWRAREVDMRHLQFELDNIRQTLDELKVSDKDARKDHEVIRREVADHVREIYKMVAAHDKWHLDKPG